MQNLLNKPTVDFSFLDCECGNAVTLNCNSQRVARICHDLSRHSETTDLSANRNPLKISFYLLLSRGFTNVLFQEE